MDRAESHLSAPAMYTLNRITETNARRDSDKRVVVMDLDFQTRTIQIKQLGVERDDISV